MFFHTNFYNSSYIHANNLDSILANRIIYNNVAELKENYGVHRLNLSFCARLCFMRYQSLGIIDVIARPAKGRDGWGEDLPVALI